MGSKVLAITVRELLQSSGRFGDPTLPGILQRTTSERGETGAENDPGIQQISVADHAFVEAGNCFVHHWQNQAVCYVYRNIVLRCVIGGGFIRFAVDPAVKALAAFSAQLLQANHFLEPPGHRAIECGP